MDRSAHSRISNSLCRFEVRALRSTHPSLACIHARAAGGKPSFAFNIPRKARLPPQARSSHAKGAPHSAQRDGGLFGTNPLLNLHALGREDFHFLRAPAVEQDCALLVAESDANVALPGAA